MVKYIPIFLLFFITTVNINGQVNTAPFGKDSIDYLNNFSYKFRFSISDSGIYYALKALSFSRSIQYHEGELSAILNLAISYQTLGDRANTLRFALEGKKKSEEYDDESWIASFLTVIGVEYHYVGEQELAIENLRNSDMMFEKLKLCNRFVATSWMGISFASLGKIDSGFYYCRKALIGARDDSCYNWLSIPLLHLGELFFVKKTFDSSLFYYRLHLGTNIRPTKFTCEAALGIAEIYRETGQRDSCLYYADLSLKTGIRSRLFPQIIESSLFLESLFEKNDPSRALDYSKMSRIYRDSLENIKYKSAFNNVADFDEQQRIAEIESTKKDYRNKLIQLVLLLGITFILIIVFILRRNNKQKEITNKSLSKAITDLKAAEAQLIQSEKMASLGELTAGIAHEIQNPLNFVNNFSDVNTELIDEAKQEIDKGNLNDAKTILDDLKDNQLKINHHGKRADGIVKGMLQHSRKSEGKKEPTDINSLCDEYLRLAFHGLRAKDKSLNAKFETSFDNSIEKINVVSQDIGRVVLNLINNAFYAVNERQKAESLTPKAGKFEPTVIVSTKKIGNKISISVKDNGNGIPESIKEKIFQPFFTTKPTGQGTGLGLSLSYDIVKAHGGELIVETLEGRGSEFTISLPFN